MSEPLDDDFPPYFDESIYEPEDKPEEMFICSVCGNLLRPSYEQWICNPCMSYDSYAYKYARNQDQQNESDYD